MQAQQQMLEDALKELKEQNSQLKKALDKIKKRNRELAEIAYQTTHDMRGPASTLQGLANILSIEDDPTLTKSLVDEVPKLLAKIDVFSKSVSDFTQLVNKPTEYQEIAWEEIFNNVVEHTSFKEKVRLKINASQQFYSDPYRIETILKHLVTNAYQYNLHHDKLIIEVDIRVEENSAELKVSDNGIGIEESKAARIFDMFYRGSIHSTGSGVGLYLVKTVVEDLNGEIILVSNQEQQGSCFSVRLPQLPAPIKELNFDF